MRKRALVTLLVLGGILTSGASFALPTTPVIAQFTYTGAGGFQGDASGTCEAYGAILDPATTFSFQGEGLRLSHAVLYENRTSIRPGHPEEITPSTPLDIRRQVSERVLPAGPYVIEGRPSSVIVLRPFEHPTGSDPTLLTAFDGSNLTWTGPGERIAEAAHIVARPGGVGPPFLLNGLDVHHGDFPGGARAFTFAEGNVAFSGSATLHMRDVAFRGPGFELDLPSFRTEIANSSLPEDAFRTLTFRLEEVFLQVEKFSLSADAVQMRMVCASVDASGSGAFKAVAATGRVGTPANETLFAAQVLTLDGDFTWTETTSDSDGGSRVEASLQGNALSVDLDFRTTGLIESITNLVDGVAVPFLTVALALAVLKQAAPALTVLYSRIRNGDLAANPIRKAILDALGGGPVTLNDLVTRLGHRPGRLRHHLGVLEQAGRVVRLKFLGQAVLVLAQSDRHGVLLRLIQDEPRLAAVHEAKELGLPRAQAILQVALRFGVGERAARKYFQMYEALNVPQGSNKT